jgi:hypothetical protein
MSKDEAFRQSLGSFGWLYRRKMFKNINNGLGMSMMERVSRRAQEIYEWSNYHYEIDEESES